MKNHLRKVRREADVTQEELANAVGTTRQSIYMIEKERLKKAPSYELMCAIAAFFGREIEEIFFTNNVIHVLQNKEGGSENVSNHDEN